MSDWHAIDAARTILEDFGNTIREARRARNWTQHDLGTASGMATPAISRVEAGIRVPEPEEVDSLASALHLDPPAPVAPTSAHARAGDPLSSERTVHSINYDASMADRIIAFAAEWYPTPFDDTDLADAFNERWPRGHVWQRNVIARSRGRNCMHALTCIGLQARERGGVIGPTLHFIHNGTTHSVKV